MSFDLNALQQSLPAQELSWLQQLRQQAFSYFEQKGFPTRFDEEWKYMKTQNLAKTFPTLLHSAYALERQLSPEKSWEFILKDHIAANDYFVLFVDGQLVSSQLPTQAQIEILSLQDVLKQNPKLVERYFENSDLSHSIMALNQALTSNGIVIRVAEHTILDKPIYCLFMHQHANAMHYQRHFIVVEKNSAATVVEKYFGVGATNYFVNHVTECYAFENARVEHIKLIQEAAESYHFSHLNIYQQRSSKVQSHVFTLSGDWIRSDIDVKLNDIDAEVELNGLFIAKGSQQVDHHTVVNHLKPHGRSSEYYKGIVDNRASATFNGKVIVAVDAQKTSALQSNKNLLLSKQAEINTKPELQIFADDVKCAHGATVGQLDESALFYLCSRGVPYNDAKQLLLYGFAMEQIEKITIPSLKQYLQQSMELANHV